MRPISVILIIIVSLLTTACSLLAPVSTPNTHTYVLNSSAIVMPHRRNHGVLLVTVENSNSPYNTTQMAYVLHPHQIAYFVLNQWADTPAHMLQPLIIQTMQRTRAFDAVVSSSYLGQYDERLTVQIGELYQDMTVGHTPTLHFSMRAVLSNVSTGRVIAARAYAIVIPMRARAPYAGVVAANEACEQLLQEMSELA